MKIGDVVGKGGRYLVCPACDCQSTLKRLILLKKNVEGSTMSACCSSVVARFRSSVSLATVRFGYLLNLSTAQFGYCVIWLLRNSATAQFDYCTIRLLRNLATA